VAHGHRVTIFDKGRNTGGRIATRRSGGLSFDHGAQFAYARGEDFGKLLVRLAVDGVVAHWPAASRNGDIVWVGTPDMNALPRAIADDLSAKGVKFHPDTHIGWINRERELSMFPAATTSPGFVSRLGGAKTAPFDAVVLAMPSPQALTLLAAHGHRFAAEIARARYAPCWSVMASFAEGSDAPDVIRSETSSLAWIARNSSRPGHAQSPETWVMHANAQWSRENLEENSNEVARLLLAEFASATGQKAVPQSLRAHRWRYALVEQSLGKPCLWDAEARIGLCGDYCLGARIEAAFNSGHALARTIVNDAPSQVVA
jgi:predicted NAD/FAD-dependent oxidoreductase